MTSDKSGSPPCGIYIRIDDFSNMLDVIGWVRKLAFTINRASGYEKNMSILELVYAPENAEKIKDIIPIIRQQGLVAIVTGGDVDADGYLFNDISERPKDMDEDKITGLICKSKAEAEAAIERSIDFITLPADPSLIAWFKSRSEVLCVADGAGITANMCEALARAGADFINVSDYILKHDKDIMQGTVNVLDALKQAEDAPKSLN